MCTGKGMIIRRNKTRPDYAMDSNDHAPLVHKLKLKDDKLEDRDFVRIELLPLNSLTSTKPKEWEFRVDEVGSLPLWFRKTQVDWEFQCKKILAEKIIPIWIKEGVGGGLYLRGSQVKTLGQLKSVGGYLDLRGTQVKTPLKNIIVSGRILT